MKQNLGRDHSLVIDALWVPTLPQEDTTIGGHLKDEDFVAMWLNLLPPARHTFVCAHLAWCEICNDKLAPFLEAIEATNPGDTFSVLPQDKVIGAMFPEETEHVNCMVGRAAEQAASEMWQTAEKEHMAKSDDKDRLTIHKTPTNDGGEELSGTPRPRESFAKEQKRLELTGKQAVAAWAMRRFPPSFGTGVVLDAGSACFEVWRAMRAGIESGAFDHIKVKTSNFGVLSDCTKATHVLQNTAVDLLGDMFDPQHEAFYVTSPDLGMFSAFRPSEMYIGASGIEIVGARVLFGFHGFLEKPHKQLLLRCPCRRRIILTTAIKIGNAGGNVIDLLTLDKADDRTPVHKAPIYLVTTLPAPGDKVLQAQLSQAQDSLFSNEMAEALTRKGLEIHWVTVDLDGNEVDDLVAPPRVGFAGLGDPQDKKSRRRA